MAGLMSAFSMPGSFGAARAQIMSKKTILTGLAVAFVIAFSAMVVSAYCADHIRKSSCGTSDEHAKQAYKWAWVSAVMSSLVWLAALGGMGWVMFRKSKTA